MFYGLVYRIDANIAWLAIGLWFAVFADLRRPRSGLFKVAPVPGIGSRLSKVVQMAHGDQCGSGGASYGKRTV